MINGAMMMGSEGLRLFSYFCRPPQKHPHGSGQVWNHSVSRMLLPPDTAPDWLNPGYHAEEDIAAALTELEYHSA